MEFEILLKIILAAVLGGIIGLEREISQKEAGLRTNILIAIGSALITIISLKMAEGKAAADPSRLAAQIVTGIGFLGAGAIIQARFAVHGLTTAATIWTVAAIGIAVGNGMYTLSLLITILVLIILTVFRFVSNILTRHKKIYAYIIKTTDRASIFADIKKIITETAINVYNARVNKVKGKYEIEILLTTSETKNKEFVEKVLQMKGVSEINSEYL